jgi:GNAT superfamily N-acetyltransferase
MKRRSADYKTTGRLLKYCAAAYNRVLAFLRPNRAANPALLNIFQRALPFFKHHWSGTRAKVWSLENLGVSPKYQGRGLGRELTLWGLEQAQRDGVPASVVVADGKEEFYTMCGFQEKVGYVTSGDKNPMKEFKGGSILFRDPVKYL